MSRDWADVRRYFDRAAVVHVATLMPDGSPHSVPVWAIAEGDEIAFFMESGSRKDKNLTADPRVAFSVTHPSNPLDMASVRGRAVRRLDGDEAMRVVDRISQAYTGGPYDLREGFVVYLVRPERSWSIDHSAE